MKPLAILLLLGASAGADDLLPQSFAKDRYAHTLAKSPFVLETKSVQHPAPPPPPENIFLRGVSTVDGKNYVLLQRPGEARTLEPLIGNETGPDGFAVESVRMGSSFRDTVVMIRSGDQVREIRFKLDALTQPTSAIRLQQVVPQRVPIPGSAGPAPRR
jgi:hypothetical protein